PLQIQTAPCRCLYRIRIPIISFLFFSRRVPSFLFPLIFRRHGFTKFEHHSHLIIGLNRFPAISTPYLNNRQQFLIKNLELQGVESKLTGASSVYIEPSISRRSSSS
ncbi:hypothetical protein LINGRAHAP2_LOCUS3788, partial [Linum grandiflorum]